MRPDQRVIRTAERPEVDVGDEVIYRASDTQWAIGEVIEVRGKGELGLSCTIGEEIITQRATHGPHVFGWLTYEEAAASK
jgi:hypothetical protein